jgi:hypothetical protein
VNSTAPKTDDYAVGYKKPPKATQFAKGRSGDPRGRPPQCKSTAALFNEVFDEEITITQNGRPRTLTKREIAFKQLANRAAKGDYQAIDTMLKHYAEREKTRDHDTESVTSERSGVIVTVPGEPGDNVPELKMLLLEAQGKAYQEYCAERNKKYAPGATCSWPSYTEEPWDNNVEETA